MKRILLTIFILLITSCTAINKYLESSNISSIEQSHEITTFDPITGNPIRTESTSTTYNAETKTVTTETVVTENVKENWFTKVLKSIQDKINYIISVALILTALFLFVKFNGIKYVREFISKFRKQIK